LGQFPPGGVAQMSVPELKPAEPLAAFADPAGDDTGPGTYTYPTDAVFDKGAYDLSSFAIARDDEDLVFTLQLNGPINNPWNSGIGLSVQTFDIYIDKDPGAGTGRRLLLEGRNAALPAGDGWDYAIWVEGWNQQVLKPDADGAPVEADGQVRVLTDPAGRVTIRVPLAALGEGDPAEWGYAVAVLSQEGFPSPGVRRVRDIEPRASQWRGGGAPADTNHTRIFDALVPEGASPTQQAGLGTYPASQETNMDELGPDDFGVLPLVRVR
jgi:carbohydrate-binding DOMON domain-containing protein